MDNKYLPSCNYNTVPTPNSSKPALHNQYCHPRTTVTSNQTMPLVSFITSTPPPLSACSILQPTTPPTPPPHYPQYISSTSNMKKQYQTSASLCDPTMKYYAGQSHPSPLHPYPHHHQQQSFHNVTSYSSNSHLLPTPSSTHASSNNINNNNSCNSYQIYVQNSHENIQSVGKSKIPVHNDKVCEGVSTSQEVNKNKQNVTFHKKKGPKKREISREDMEKYFNVSQTVAAKLLGVSVSTLKRR